MLSKLERNRTESFLTLSSDHPHPSSVVANRSVRVFRGWEDRKNPRELQASLNPTCNLSDCGKQVMVQALTHIIAQKFDGCARAGC